MGDEKKAVHVTRAKECGNTLPPVAANVDNSKVQHLKLGFVISACHKQSSSGRFLFNILRLSICICFNYKAKVFLLTLQYSEEFTF